MIETLLGLGLMFSPVTSVDPPVPQPYTAPANTCQVVADVAPDWVEWCRGAETTTSGLGYQIEMGDFRFNLTEGDFHLNAYIANYRYSYPFGDSGLQTARVLLGLVCVSDEGDIRANGEFVPVIANKSTASYFGADIEGSGSGSVTLSTSGPCSVGEQREIFTAAVVSDSADPFWTPETAGRDANAIGWDDGVRSIGSAITWSVVEAPDYGDTGRLLIAVDNSIGITSDMTHRQCEDVLSANGIQSSLYGQANNLNGQSNGGVSGGWCSVFINGMGPAHEGPGTLGVNVFMASQGGYAQFVLGRGGADGEIYGRYLPVGAPDRYMPDGIIYTLSTLTRYQAVADIEWAPTEQDLTMGDVPGICDDLGDCIQRCFDQDYTWNPLSWWDGLLETIRCLVVPETDFTELTDAALYDFNGSLMMQSMSFYVDRTHNLVTMPTYYARGCGSIVEIQDPYEFSLSTCQLTPDARQIVRWSMQAIIGIAGAVAFANLVFWGAGVNSPKWLGGEGQPPVDQQEL